VDSKSNWRRDSTQRITPNSGAQEYQAELKNLVTLLAYILTFGHGRKALNQPRTVSRTDLYERAWSTPMRKSM
jgi:hypothetical protein